MTAKQQVEHEVNNATDLRNTFWAIRTEVERTATREDLTRLYRRAGVLVTLTSSPPWRKKFGSTVDDLRRVAEAEFTNTVRVINHRAAEIGTEPDYDETWGGEERHAYGEVDNVADLRHIFEAIRRDVANASSRQELTELYRRAGYLATLTFAPAWQKKFGSVVDELRRVAEREFASTARAINERAAAIGVEPNYDETWGASSRSH
jgi:hypothetical protein